MIPMEPRKPGCNVIEGKDISLEKVQKLTQAADNCWNSIMNMDFNGFASAYRDSFNAQTALFPGMIQGSVQSYIDRYSAMPDVHAWKMPGAGGGGYLALVVTDSDSFCHIHPEAISLHIRRK